MNVKANIEAVTRNVHGASLVIKITGDVQGIVTVPLNPLEWRQWETAAADHVECGCALSVSEAK